MMGNENQENSERIRLHELVAEVEGSSNVKMKNTSVDQEASNLLAALLRCSVFSLFCLGVGIWLGSYSTKLHLSLQQPSEPQALNTQGWREDGTGVFYRWCKESCNTPRLYGGGVIQVFEVKCVDRPCGDIFMRFNVLNPKGEIVDQLLLKEEGLQGETRRFFVESQNPDAASLELSEFTSRARV